MKKYFVYLLLLSNVYLFAQVKNVSFQSDQYISDLKINFNKDKQRFTFSQLQLYTDNDFSIYNKTTMLNDNFSFYNGQLEYKNSILIPANTLFNNKIDSFNPNGACDFTSALFTGLLNLTLGLFQSE